ncbi:MAG: hypothetical protein KJ600_03965 [Nanoarchaeota archaeon]|nr:hypothetical protein [Nanoarchaeota archaeon]MBU1103683.1 hypothetical protein [Nanoarchaeota archaeon]
MRLNKNIIAGGLMVLTAGCSAESYRAGLSYRSVGLRSALFDVRETIPLVSVGASGKMAEKWEGHAGLDLIVGEKYATQEPFAGSAQGEFYSANLGASYFPFCKHFSLDLGGEMFYADVDQIHGYIGRVGMRFGDSVWGWGINVGATGKIPLGEHANFIFSGRYNLTDNVGNSGKATYDFGGLQVFFGLEFNLR